MIFLRYIMGLWRPTIVLLGLFGSFLGLFVVDQTEQVLVTEFGQLKRTITKPGLYWMVPFIQTTTKYDKRVLNCDISEIELTLGDQKRIVVSVFSRYFISNPELFYKTVQTEERAKQRLDVIINGDLRNILGKCQLKDISSEKRAQIEHQLNKQIRESAKSMGIDMAEIKLRSILFPDKNLLAVFDRMKSERLREAQEFRGEAVKASSEIKGKADIQAAEILAQASLQSKSIIGSAEARAMKIKNAIYAENLDFAGPFIAYKSYEQGLDSAEFFLNQNVTNPGTEKQNTINPGTEKQYLQYMKPPRI